MKSEEETTRKGSPRDKKTIIANQPFFSFERIPKETSMDRKPSIEYKYISNLQRQESEIRLNKQQDFYKRDQITSLKQHLRAICINLLLISKSDSMVTENIKNILNSIDSVKIEDMAEFMSIHLIPLEFVT